MNNKRGVESVSGQMDLRLKIVKQRTVRKPKISLKGYVYSWSDSL